MALTDSDPQKITIGPIFDLAQCAGGLADFLHGDD